MKAEQTTLGGCCEHGDWDQSCPICNTQSKPFHERIGYLIEEGLRPAAERLISERSNEVVTLAAATDRWIKARDKAMRNPALAQSDEASRKKCQKDMEELAAAEAGLEAAFKCLNDPSHPATVISGPIR